MCGNVYVIRFITAILFATNGGIGAAARPAACSEIACMHGVAMRRGALHQKCLQRQLKKTGSVQCADSTRQAHDLCWIAGYRNFRNDHSCSCQARGCRRLADFAQNTAACKEELLRALHTPAMTSLQKVVAFVRSASYEKVKGTPVIERKPAHSDLQQRGCRDVPSTMRCCTIRFYLHGSVFDVSCIMEIVSAKVSRICRSA